MYNSALPGEYLELSLPSLPTPPSSTENSGEQFLPSPMQARQVPDGYLRPRVQSVGVRPSYIRAPRHAEPAENMLSAMTSFSVHPTAHHPDNVMETRMRPSTGQDMDEDDMFQSSYHSDTIQEVLPLDFNRNRSFKRKQRSQSESAYHAAATSHHSFGKTGSSESGYGTATHLSSVTSDRDRPCGRCGHLETGDDEVFVEEQEA